MNNISLGIVGLGLMGGSLALSAKKIPFISDIYGYDHNIDHQKEARELNLVDKIVTFKELKGCDIIILAIPVNGIVNILPTLVDVKESCTIIDFGGTKEKIIKAVPKQIRENFVAAHPMAGTEYFGPSAAIDNLYADKVLVICDFEDSGKRQQKLSVSLFNELNMRIHYMSASEHDRHAAFISHMPHVISYSIANTVLSQEKKEDILTLAAGGFRSMSRLAKSSPNMWEDIFRQNSNNIIEAVELFEDELKELKESIKRGDYKYLNKKMQNANRLQEIFS